MNIYRLNITVMERLYFASREIGEYFLTDALISNTALPYALGLCNSSYIPPRRPQYRDHFADLNMNKIYVTPATIEGGASFIQETANALSESYWYSILQNRIEVDRASVGTKKGAKVSNYPQRSYLKMLARGNKLSAYLLSKDDIRLPEYVRIGKFNSKCKIEQDRVDFKTVDNKEVMIKRLLNPIDLPKDCQLKKYNVINTRPVSLIKEAKIQGDMYYIPKYDEYLPTNMEFGV